MNQAFLIGRLTRDPQGGALDSGKKWAKFSIAVNRYGDKTADFINIVAWDKQAETVLKYLVKGRQVAITGRIQTGSYERDGVKHTTFDIVAMNVEFIGGGENSGQKSNSDASIDTLREVDEDDIPF